MTENTEVISPTVIYADDKSLSFSDGGKEVVLPRLDEYKPRNDGLIHKSIEENAKGEAVTYYSFESKDEQFECSYGINKDGSVSVKLNGKEEVKVSKESMAEIKNKIKSKEQKEFFKAVGYGVAGILVHPGLALIPCGVELARKYKEINNYIPMNLINHSSNGR